MGKPESIGIGIICICILVRWLVGRFPHSGENVPPLYGDYEAQRHWMEITTNLAPSEWYKNSTNNNLSYWGLDYPPLSAYHMLLNGAVSNLLNPSWTELESSKGEESYEHKIFMRATVLLSDIVVYMTAIIYYFKHVKPVDFNNSNKDTHKNKLIFTLFALIYPAQILIDHGHFQYNCVFMGLTVWSVILLTKGRQLSAALVFSLALNYKQMALYYALPFFWYLFSKNIRSLNIVKGLINILLLAITVTLTFAICWTPFLTDLQTASQVLNRLFPFNRGLFEDKVANIWCCLSVIVKLKQIYNIDFLIKLSTGLTLLGTLPTGLHLLWRPSLQSFRYALINSSLVFFLTSFQVHEKTILVPAMPILLLFREHPLVVNWFVIVSTFSLQPLLIKDKLMNPYFILLIIYLLQSIDVFRTDIYLSSSRKSDKLIATLFRLCYFVSILGCLVLSVISLVIEAPKRYPDIHPVINSMYCCGHLIFFLGFFTYQQFKCPMDTTVSTVRIRKKND